MSDDRLALRGANGRRFSVELVHRPHIRGMEAWIDDEHAKVYITDHGTPAELLARLIVVVHELHGNAATAGLPAKGGPARHPGDRQGR